MIRRRIGYGLLAGVVGCTASAGGSSGAPSSADSFAASPTSTAFDSGSTDPGKATSGLGEGQATSNSDATPATSVANSAEPDTSEVNIEGNDGGATRVSCDPRKLLCKRVEPACDYGYVPRIVDGCYAECVRIDECLCDGPDACPQHDRYTCNNSRQRCTPYLR